MVALCDKTMIISEEPAKRGINHFGETALWLLMNFSHATTNAGYSIAARRSFCLQAGIWRQLCVLLVKERELLLRAVAFLHLLLWRCFNIASPTCAQPLLCFFPSVSSRVCSVLMNERGELWLSFSVFLGLCACGLCGLSHSEEPWGDIFGHGLSWVQAHTESLTDAGEEERGMFSYWEETRPDYGGERETKRKGRWLCVFQCVCLCVGQRWAALKDYFILILTPILFVAHIFKKLLIWNLGQ